LPEPRHDDEVRAGPLRERRGVVARAAVDDDVLDRAVRLCGDAGQRAPDETAGVQSGRDDAD
jgi:hypothetical protein